MRKPLIALSFALVTSITQAILLSTAVYMTQNISANTILCGIGWIILFCILPALPTGAVFAIMQQTSAKPSQIASTTAMTCLFITLIVLCFYLAFCYYTNPGFLGSPASLLTAFEQYIGYLVFASFTDAFLCLIISHIFMLTHR